MSYRSDVVIAVDKKTFFAESVIKGNVPQVLMEPDQHSHQYSGEAVYFKLEQWEWYGKDSDNIMEWLNSMDEDKWGLVRIGEESDDIETAGDYYEFAIYPQTYISCPVDF